MLRARFKTSCRDASLAGSKGACAIPGAFCRLAYRCLWDDSSDNHASEVFSNENIICVASAFGVYKY